MFSDVRKIGSDLNWKPRGAWHERVDIVLEGVREHRNECAGAVVSARIPWRGGQRRLAKFKNLPRPSTRTYSIHP
jgi:hypothetical protein